MKEEIKRLFFGIEVHAPWPYLLPKGRILDQAHRHITLEFLGNIPYEPLKALLDHFPKPSMPIGIAGYFDSCLTLPHRHPHVVAWHAHWLDDNAPLAAFQSQLSLWLHSHQYSIDTRPWKPHVTICRQPFDSKEWKETFKPLPLYTSSIHLYESIGNLNYMPLWSYFVQPPFEEIEHTADIAFIIRGESLQQLYVNAFTSLSFKAPELLDYFAPGDSLNTLDDLIILLNTVICQTDGAVGCPMKAISFHGKITTLPDGLLQWEMIVDV